MAISVLVLASWRQRLVAIGFAAGALIAAAIRLDGAARALLEAQRLVRRAIDELRAAVTTLREPLADARPLNEMIQEPDLSLRFETSGAPRALSSETRLALFRAAQEACSNITKHAEAKAATISLSFDEEPPRVELRVEDNGIGGAISERGFGLVGMRERAKALGEQVEVTSCSGSFVVRMEIPQ